MPSATCPSAALVGDVGSDVRATRVRGRVAASAGFRRRDNFLLHGQALKWCNPAFLSFAAAYFAPDLRKSDRVRVSTDCPTETVGYYLPIPHHSRGGKPAWETIDVQALL
jgi:hypothetical protein